MATMAGTLPELRAAYAKLDAVARAQGITIAVADYGGVRTLADTNRILRYRDDDFRVAVQRGEIAADTTLNRFRPIAPFGRSYHNYGAAFDVLLVGRPAGMSESKAFAVLGAAASRCGLRWGGTFRDADPPHFELPISLADAQQRYVAAGGTATTVAGAAPVQTMPAWDLSTFLPSLTPTGAAGSPGAAGFPPVSAMDTHEETGNGGSEVADFSELSYDEPGGSPDQSMLMLAVVVVGVVAWALRERFAR